MSKERLEEVKDTYQSVESLIELGDFKQADIAMCYLVENFGKWLIEQAERVQELENEIENQEIEISNWEESYFEIEKQNQRYREALEFYADKGTYEVVETLPPTDEYHQPMEPVFKTVPIIYYDKGKEARKALEGEE